MTTGGASKVQSDKVQQPKLGVLGSLRWFWRQLTSMRTALFLLLLIAIAAIPGSIFPQRSIDINRVTQYKADHPSAFPWLDRLGMFNVYSSPWFAAIYLLLSVSLIGCILPRIKVHWKAVRQGPPAMPRNIGRLSASDEVEMDASPDAVMDAARSVLRRKRFRFRKDVGDDAISAEGGMLRETGNLMFHISMVGIIVSVAAGHVWAWRGDVIVTEGSSFASTLTAYDTLNFGPWVSPDKDIPNWSLQLKKLNVTFEDKVSPSSPQWGQPRDFTANLRYKSSPNASWKNDNVKVNHPLGVGGGEVYLLGNGYSPKIVFRNAQGKVIYDEATPFLPIDNQYKSTGAFKITGATPKQIGMAGFFLPTAYVSSANGPSSAFPGLDAPALYLGLYTGNLFPAGRPESVFSFDTNGMTQVKDAKGDPIRLMIQMGQTVKLPNNLGSVTFESAPRWAGLSIRHDPGKMPALAFSVLGLLGLVLSLTIRRRRVFVRVHPAADGRSLVEIGGLAKGEDPRLAQALEDITKRIEAAIPAKKA